MRAGTINWAMVMAVCCLMAARADAQATSPVPDKSRFTLFNPTPRALMRDMDTDRPDTTESPYTVDAGHVQIEFSLTEYARDDGMDGPVGVAGVRLFTGYVAHEGSWLNT